MANHAIVRTDNLQGTVDGSKLVSLKYFVDATATEIDNGSLVALDSLMDGEREVWKAVSPTTTTALGSLVLVATPEVMYDERKKNLDEFYNEAGVAARGYVLCSGDTFSVTSEALDGASAATAVGAIVEAQNGVKGKVVTTLTSGSTKIGTIIAIEQVGSKKYFVIRVA